jgi:glucokinase
MTNNLVMGADIGGSHITVGMVNLQERRLVSPNCVRKPVNSHASAEEIISVWSSAMLELYHRDNVSPGRIGIAIPGPFDYEVGISLIKDQDKYDALYGLNVKNLLSEKLSIQPSDINLINDAGCFLQGEAFGGAAYGFDDAIGVMLGTGLGTAKYHNKVSEDANLWCSPFNDGIAEDYLSTRWFVKRYKEIAGETILNVKELSDRANTDANARKVFDEFGRNLGVFLNKFINDEKPQVLVCGGNISNAFDLFGTALTKQLLLQQNNVTVKKVHLGEESALVGAASSWSNSLEKTNN